jgi:hypothetical protein
MPRQIKNLESQNCLAKKLFDKKSWDTFLYLLRKKQKTNYKYLTKIFFQCRAKSLQNTVIVAGLQID